MRLQTGASPPVLSEGRSRHQSQSTRTEPVLACPGTPAVLRSQVLTHRSIISLQRVAGNSAVASLLGTMNPRQTPEPKLSLQRCPGGCPPGACEDHKEPEPVNNDAPKMQLHLQRRPGDPEPSHKVVSRAAGAPGSESAPTPASCQYQAWEVDRSLRSGGRRGSKSSTCDDKALLVYDFVHGSTMVRAKHQDLLSEVVAECHLASTTPRRKVVRIIGFTDCKATERTNAPIRIGRAEAVRRFLIDTKGARPENVGPAAVDLSSPPGNNSPGDGRDLMRSVRLELDRPPPPPCPPCPEDPRTAGCPPCPARHVCGPDVDSHLTAVLMDMQSYFRGMSRWRRHRSCQQLTSPFG